MRVRSVILPVVVLLAAACGGDGATTTTPASPPPGTTGSPEPSGEPGQLSLSSPAFAEGETIPVKHSCNGENVSPQLDFAGVPDGTAELALAMTDPDAGDFPHWFVWRLPPDLTGLQEGAVPPEAIQWSQGYAGPCPPAGAPHHYVFRLIALSEPVALDAEAAQTVQPLEVLAAFDAAGPIATAELVGQFGV